MFFFIIISKIWLHNCPSEFKPLIYTKYVDDTFLLFHLKLHIEKFYYLNCQHKNIRFTSETENEHSLSFLDIKISQDNNKFTTSIYQFLPTLQASSQSHINTTCCSPYYKVYCLNFELFHQEIDKLRTIFENIGYPKS